MDGERSRPGEAGRGLSAPTGCGRLHLCVCSGSSHGRSLARVPFLCLGNSDSGDRSPPLRAHQAAQAASPSQGAATRVQGSPQLALLPGGAAAVPGVRGAEHKAVWHRWARGGWSLAHGSGTRSPQLGPRRSGGDKAWWRWGVHAAAGGTRGRGFGRPHPLRGAAPSRSEHLVHAANSPPKSSQRWVTRREGRRPLPRG